MPFSGSLASLGEPSPGQGGGENWKTEYPCRTPGEDGLPCGPILALPWGDCRGLQSPSYPKSLSNQICG